MIHQPLVFRAQPFESTAANIVMTEGHLPQIARVPCLNAFYSMHGRTHVHGSSRKVCFPFRIVPVCRRVSTMNTPAEGVGRMETALTARALQCQLVASSTMCIVILMIALQACMQRASRSCRCVATCTRRPCCPGRTHPRSVGTQSRMLWPGSCPHHVRALATKKADVTAPQRRSSGARHVARAATSWALAKRHHSTSAAHTTGGRRRRPPHADAARCPRHTAPPRSLPALRTVRGPHGQLTNCARAC